MCASNRPGPTDTGLIDTGLIDPARRLWQAVEPIHAVVYFDPRPTDALRDLGLRGFWMSYFAGRFAPLGRIGPAPVTAMAFGFAPWMAARALPDAWTFAEPADVLAARTAAAAGVLAEQPAHLLADLDELVELLTTAVAGCDCGGRPLAAGWQDAGPPADPVARLWWCCGVLREHRGDGHVLAMVAAGLSGLEATVTLVGTGELARERIQPHRGWTDEEWDAAALRLVDRGLLDADGRLTASGTELRRRVEADTDRLAAGSVRRLGPDALDRAVELATPLSQHLVDTGAVPVPNPIGVPRPATVPPGAADR